MIFRPAADSDLTRILPLLVPDPASTLTAEKYQARMGSGEYLIERTWIAESGPGSELAAVGIWWASPPDPRPVALDGLLVRESVVAADRVDLAAGLLTAAHAAFASEGVPAPPGFHVFLPGDWRDRPDVVEALTWRQDAARRAGLTASLERLRYEWTPQAGVPGPPSRLRFRAEPDDDAFAELFRQVLDDSLDATTGREAARMGADAQARQDVALYRDQMLGDRSWWRIAETPDGEPVGFAIPSRNADCAVVGYLGVLPGHRGRGYVDDILAEITRILATDAGAEVIRADTDLANRPMAAAFERAGYQNFARRLVLSAS